MAKLTGNCPICDAKVTAAGDTQETEIITCLECESRIVVDAINGRKLSLEEAPVIEEDWGQ